MKWPGKVGESWRIYYWRGNPNNKTIHIRAIVDEHAIVYATWCGHKGWRHSIEYRTTFDIRFERGLIKKTKPKFPTK